MADAKEPFPFDPALKMVNASKVQEQLISNAYDGILFNYDLQYLNTSILSQFTKEGEQRLLQFSNPELYNLSVYLSLYDGSTINTTHRGTDPRYNATIIRKMIQSFDRLDGVIIPLYSFWTNQELKADKGIWEKLEKDIRSQSKNLLGEVTSEITIPLIPMVDSDEPIPLSLNTTKKQDIKNRTIGYWVRESNFSSVLQAISEALSK
eukprot:g3851.t1